MINMIIIITDTIIIIMRNYDHWHQVTPALLSPSLPPAFKPPPGLLIIMMIMIIIIYIMTITMLI